MYMPLISGPSTMINAPLIARDAIIQKINSQENASKVNEKQNEDFVIGEIYNAERYHVSVKYINNKGQTDYVHVNTSHEHNFKDGDRVKVINKKNWDEDMH